MMKTIFMLMSFCVLLFNTSCESKKEKEEKDKFQVTSPLKKDTVLIREYVCQIHAIQHIEQRALVKGYLEKIFVDEGQYVKQGQLMFQILPIQYQAELRKAQAEADYAEIEFQNAKILSDSNVISPIQLALVKAKFEKAKAELSFAQTRMTFTEIRAPFNGLMDLFHVRLGSLLDEGDLLTTMSDISELWVYFNVPESEYITYKQNLKLGDDPLKVRLKMANHELFEEVGVVKTIEADFNNQTGNVIVTKPLKDAIMIPQKATFEVLDQMYVYVLDKNDVLKSRRITIAAEMPDLYVIKDGVDEHDKILLEGLRKVKENDKIAYEYEEPKEVISHLALYAE